MQELTENPDKISKEIRLGIFDAKTNVYLPKPELEKIEKRIKISEIFGEESIPYIENYELLKERIQSLKDFDVEADEGAISLTEDKGNFGPYIQSKRKDIVFLT